MALVAAALTAGCFHASPERVLSEQLFESYESRTVVSPALPPTTAEGARRTAREYRDSLTRSMGPVVGYKAALTSPDAQAAFGVTEPVWGTLHRDMLCPAGARFSERPGARPMIEADLVVRIGSPSISAATTRMDVLKSIDAVFPFLEIPDLLLDPDVPPSGLLLSAMNAGARAGILGDPVNIQPTREWMDRLAGVHAKLVNANGVVLAQGSSETLMEHPLDVVLWLIDALAAEGIALRPGDYISLGSLTPLRPIEPGATLRAVYTNLDPDAPVSIGAGF